ncbi:MAG: coenzyme F420-0:L-glutamate ligase [Candidatus Methylarchaceae archaeon HK01M]|nr:coenzyme F420-0:L-glutamate ligase [Candidatus Methylarchaceae archaeon HK01M]
MKYMAIPIKTKYWKPGDDYIDIIKNSIIDKIEDGDMITVSEKAISVAKGRLIDERDIKPSLLARFISLIWMRYVWGYILAKICHLKLKNVYRLRRYPRNEGAAHKQVALKYAGFLQALRHGSEGGIDVSNLPFSYACLPLDDPYEEVRRIRAEIQSATGKKVCVMVVDTDMTYSWHNLHFTPLPRPIRGIVSGGGFIAYVIGRGLRLKYRATPLAVSSDIGVDRALDISQLSHKLRKSGAGRTAWDVAERFDVGLTEVTLEMLDRVEHYPIVLIRSSKIR